MECPETFLIHLRVKVPGQGPTVLAVGVGWGVCIIL